MNLKWSDYLKGIDISLCTLGACVQVQWEGRTGDSGSMLNDCFSQSTSVLGLLHEEPQKCSLEMSRFYVFTSYFLYSLWFTALKWYPVFHSICFSIIKTCYIPKWLCFTNALFNPETESSWCWPQKFNSWKSRFSTHLDEWCHLDPILASGAEFFWFLLNIWHHTDNSLNVSYHSCTCHVCLEESLPQLS